MNQTYNVHTFHSVVADTFNSIIGQPGADEALVESAERGLNVLDTLTDRIKQHSSEDIPKGLILEFDDILNHFLDQEYWDRYIQSLSYLVRSENYYHQILAPINVMQQCEIRVDDRLPAPMAVSLIDPNTLFSKKMPKIRSSAKPFLIINPTQLFISITLGSDSDILKSNELYHAINGILIHETYHISRGDLLVDTKHHFTSASKSKEYQIALEGKGIPMLKDGAPAPQTADDGSTIIDEEYFYGNISNIHEMSNILSDLSINTAVMNIDNQLLPQKMYKNHLISNYSIGGGLQHAIDSVNIQRNGYKTPQDFGIHTISDFLDDKVVLRDKQYALLEYRLATMTDDEEEEAAKQAESQKDKNGGIRTEGDIMKKHQEARENMEDDEIDNIVAKSDNQMNIANAEASEETGGKAYSIAPSGELREKIIEIKRAKSLPRFDAKVKGFIKDFQNKRSVNYNRRHIAYPGRMDLGHIEKRNTKANGGMYVYFDVSGSVTDEMISNIFNILMATVKQEPVKLFIFASKISKEPLVITKKTDLEEVHNYIQNQAVGMGTTLKPVFKQIIEEKEYKHVIISDYQFYMSEFTAVEKTLADIFIIHCFQPSDWYSLESFKESVVYKFITRNKNNQKLININNYTV